MAQSDLKVTVSLSSSDVSSSVQSNSVNVSPSKRSLTEAQQTDSPVSSSNSAGNPDRTKIARTDSAGRTSDRLLVTVDNQDAGLVLGPSKNDSSQPHSPSFSVRIQNESAEGVRSSALIRPADSDRRKLDKVPSKKSDHSKATEKSDPLMSPKMDRSIHRRSVEAESSISSKQGDCANIEVRSQQQTTSTIGSRSHHHSSGSKQLSNGRKPPFADHRRGRDSRRTAGAGRSSDNNDRRWRYDRRSQQSYSDGRDRGRERRPGDYDARTIPLRRHSKSRDRDRRRGFDRDFRRTHGQNTNFRTSRVNKIRNEPDIAPAPPNRSDLKSGSSTTTTTMNTTIPIPAPSRQSSSVMRSGDLMTDGNGSEDRTHRRVADFYRDSRVRGNDSYLSGSRRSSRKDSGNGSSHSDSRDHHRRNGPNHNHYAGHSLHSSKENGRRKGKNTRLSDNQEMGANSVAVPSSVIPPDFAANSADDSNAEPRHRSSKRPSSAPTKSSIRAGYSLSSSATTASTITGSHIKMSSNLATMSIHPERRPVYSIQANLQPSSMVITNSEDSRMDEPSLSDPIHPERLRRSSSNVESDSSPTTDKKASSVDANSSGVDSKPSWPSPPLEFSPERLGDQDNNEDHPSEQTGILDEVDLKNDVSESTVSVTVVSSLDQPSNVVSSATNHSSSGSSKVSVSHSSKKSSKKRKRKGEVNTSNGGGNSSVMNGSGGIEKSTMSVDSGGQRKNSSASSSSSSSSKNSRLHDRYDTVIYDFVSKKLRRHKEGFESRHSYYDSLLKCAKRATAKYEEREAPIKRNPQRAKEFLGKHQEWILKLVSKYCDKHSVE